MKITITNYKGVTLETNDRYCTEDIDVVIDLSTLKAENIKKGVNVLGIVGTYEPTVSTVSEHDNK